MSKRLLLVTVISFVLLLCGCTSISNELETSETSEISETSDSLEVSSTASNKSELSINEITMVDDFECKIVEVNWYAPEDFDFDFAEPEDGYEYIVIVLSEKNTTNNTENAPACTILSADGRDCVSVPALSLYKNKYKINFGSTLPGSEAEAYVTYKVPADAESFMLQILSNGFGANSNYIVFSRDEIQ